MVLPASTIAVLLITMVALWGVGGWALVRSLGDEERKLELLERQETFDTYSPRVLSELREWINSHPDHPRVDDATTAYNDCVDRLTRIEETFYDWDETTVDDLERL